MLNKFFPIVNIPTSINPFNVLITCIILNICTISICYRIINNHSQEVESFIFDHNNNTFKYHPCFEKFAVRLDELEDKVNIYHPGKM